MRCNRPIFIVGAARSGTTLLQRMLRSHPNISSPTGESQFVVPLDRDRASFGDLTRLDNVRRVVEVMYRTNPEYLETDFHGLEFDLDLIAKALHQEGRASIEGLIAALFELNARGENKTRWADKTPYYILHLERIKTMFPDAQIIHVIRDGRDVALSMLGRRFDLDIHNVFAAAERWKHYVDAGQAFGRHAGPDEYIQLRYEDVLSAPRETMGKLCDFLGEPYSEKIVEFDKSSDPKSRTPLLAKPLQKNNWEKWREQMSGRQIRVFEGVAGETLNRNGYRLVDKGRALGPAERTLYRIHSRGMRWLARRRGK
jgi:hypothetical protein